MRITPSQSTTTSQRMTRQFLVHLDERLIRRVKILAIERGVSASSLVGMALSAFLDQADGGSPGAASASEADR
jgi:hypothetical protein